MSIWLTKATPKMLNESTKRTLPGHLGMEFLEIGDDYIKARMPVDSRTMTSFGILHGGASAAFAETLGGVAAELSVDRKRKLCVGLEINANHIRPVDKGFVYGTTTPIHIGDSTQIWEVRIHNEQAKLICISRLTVAVIDKR
jgi:uncharacterized protein (TIGR00369 family)